MKKNNLFKILLKFEKGKPTCVTGLLPCFLYDVLKNLFNILQGVLKSLWNLLKLLYNVSLHIVKTNPSLAAAIIVTITLISVIVVIILLIKRWYTYYHLKSF